MALGVTHMEKRMSPLWEAGLSQPGTAEPPGMRKQTPLFPPPIAWRVGAAGQREMEQHEYPSPLAGVSVERPAGKRERCHALLAFAGDLG